MASAGGCGVSYQKEGGTVGGEMKSITARVCWMDHPHLRKKLTEVTPHLVTSRNAIVQLPNRKLVTTKFRCAICEEIPFPWSWQAQASKDNDMGEKCRWEMGNMTQGILLCQKGHPVCRKCFSYFNHCAADLLKLELLDSKMQKATAKRTATKQRASSMTNFGQIVLCKAPFITNPEEEDLAAADGFLENMIDMTEFACLYFYNFCSFRGKVRH